MRAKTKKYSLGLLVAAFVASATCATALGSVRFANAEGGVKAEYARTDVKTGSAWEGKYGSKGYVVIGSDESVTGNTGKSQFYSSLYEGNDGKTIMQRDGWGYNKVGSVDGTLKESSPISDWGLSAVTWDTADAGARDYRLYRPGTTTKMTYSRAVNGWQAITSDSFSGQGWLRDTGVYFTVKENDPLYVTTSIVETSNKISAEKPLTVSVYKLERSGTVWMEPAHDMNKRLNWTDSVADGVCSSVTLGEDNHALTAAEYMEAYYGEALATTTISQQTSYVSFKLEGAGDYRIVAYYENEAYETSPLTPMIHGFFFDEDINASAQTASYVETTTKYGCNWEASPYGVNGYIVLNGEANSVYSNIYVDKATDRLPDGNAVDPVTVSNWHYGDKNTWLTAENKEISSYAPIDKWSMQSQTWTALPTSWASAPIATSLYKPGTTDSTAARSNSGWSQEVLANAQSMTIYKSQKEATYVTLYVNNLGGCDSETKISVLNDATLFAWQDANKTFDEYYNGDVIATATMNKVGYITFKLEGTGYFQFVAQKGANGTQAPMITGMFFNNDQPNTKDAQADSVTGTNWQSTYGKDGYIVFDIDQTSNSEMAYTKGIYSNGDGAYTGAVTYVKDSVKFDAAKTQPEFAVSDEGLSLSNALISRYGTNVSIWQYRNWLDGSEASNGDIYSSNMLQKPDSSDKVAVRLGGANLSDRGYAGFAFTVTADAVKNGGLYVTIYHNNSCDGYKDNVNFNVKLYNEYHSSEYVNKRPESEAIQTNEVSLARNTHFYSTFYIMAAGDYSIVVEPDNGVARGNISAVFFDKSAPSPATSGSYNISYVVEGGTTGDNPTSYTYAKGVSAFADAIPSDNTKTFKGWYQDTSFTKEVKSIPVGMNVDITLYAKFAKNIVISYNVGAGKNDADNPEAVEGGVKVILKDAIAPEHFLFDGWYTSADFAADSKVVNNEYQTTEENVKFYAKFIEVRKINITYVLNGGTNDASNPEWFYLGEGVSSLADASRDGYTFEGWYLDEDFEDEVTAILNNTTEDVTLYAKFEKIPVYSDVNYVLDGGNNAAANPDSYEEGIAVTLADASKDGYTFEGWYTDAAFENEVTEISAEQTGAITLYAKFVKIIVTSSITYVLDGGNNASANPSSYQEGSAVTLADASKEGYTFDGWYTDAAFENKVTEISAEQTGNITLYAKFTAIEVEKKGCGASLALAPMAAVLGIAVVAVLKKKED